MTGLTWPNLQAEVLTRLHDEQPVEGISHWLKNAMHQRDGALPPLTTTSDEQIPEAGNSQPTTINALRASVDQMDRNIEAMKAGTAFYATPEDTQAAQDAQDAELPLPECDNKSDRDDSENMKPTCQATTSPSRRSTPQRERKLVGPGPFRQLISWKSTLQSIEGALALQRY